MDSSATYDVRRTTYETKRGLWMVERRVESAGIVRISTHSPCDADSSSCIQEISAVPLTRNLKTGSGVCCIFSYISCCQGVCCPDALGPGQSENGVIY